MLVLTLLWTLSLLWAYILTRQAVNLGEYLLTWRGAKRSLREKLRSATSWGEWISIARQMDQLLGLAEWRETEASGLYDFIMIKKVTRSLRQFRERKDVDNLLGVLDLCLRSNFAGVEGFRLYSETYFGTKRLIENYVDEVERSLRFVEHAGPDLLSLETKRSFYRAVRRRLGTSALCLSGGASFAYYHFGVARAMLDAGLLPKVVTGTSAGGLVAALVCTRHDYELDRLLVPELADHLTACQESVITYGPRMWRTGARFDPQQFAQKAQFFTMGSLTFLEAYQRTGKTLNISVIPSDRNSPVKVLNYHTAPDCVIWSALLASAAIPGVLPPICLMQKSKSGQLSPMNWGHRFKDGSLRNDIPLAELQTMGVNYPIVSQANPHVHLFFFAPRGMPGRPVAHRKGRGWRGGFLLAAIEHFLKLQLGLSMQFLKDLDLIPELLGQDWSTAFLQSFGGTVTVWPKTRLRDWPRILTDPDRPELHRMLQVGQSVTFPKLHMIENRMRIERAVENVRRAVHTDAKRKRAISNGHNQAVEHGIERAIMSGIGRALAQYQTHEPLTDTDGEVEVPSRSSRSKRTPALYVNGRTPPIDRYKAPRACTLDVPAEPSSEPTPTSVPPASPGFPSGAQSTAGSTGDEQYVSAPEASDAADDASEPSEPETERAADHQFDVANEPDDVLTASILAQPRDHEFPPSRSLGMLSDSNIPFAS